MEDESFFDNQSASENEECINVSMEKLRIRSFSCNDQINLLNCYVPRLK